MLSAAVLVELIAAGRGTDPDWPPILVALVFAVVGGAAVCTFVIFRRLRAAARGDRRQGEGPIR